jgi:hypothetical protein
VSLIAGNDGGFQFPFGVNCMHCAESDGFAGNGMDMSGFINKFVFCQGRR